MTVPRLFTPHPLGPGMAVTLDAAQAHYLGAVMRLDAGNAVELFNGAAGGWRARLVHIDKRQALLSCEAQLRPQESVPDLWLLAAPLRKSRFEWVVEKACELGVAVLKPVATRRSLPERLRTDRLAAIAIEAAEQCGRTGVTAIEALEPLAAVLDAWPASRRLLFCDETGGPPLAQRLGQEPRGQPWAILIGPEGGFDPAERERLLALPQAVPVSLGPRILRADTAAVVAVAGWQAALGDWWL